MASRYRNTATGIATASGTATFTFQAPPPGVVITGSLGIPSASSTSIATVTIGGVTWGSWAGNATFGPVQQWTSETISVSVSGLTAGSIYSLVFIGMAEDETNAQIIWPSALATSLSTTNVTVAAFHGAMITNTATQNIPNAVFTLVAFDTAIQDSDSFFDNVNDRLVVPAGLAGTYLLTGYFSFQTGASIANPSQIEIDVQVNNAIITNLNMTMIGNVNLAPSRQFKMFVSSFVALGVGDTVRLVTLQSTGVAITADGDPASTNARSYLSCVLVGV